MSYIFQYILHTALCPSLSPHASQLNTRCSYSGMFKVWRMRWVTAITDNRNRKFPHTHKEEPSCIQSFAKSFQYTHTKNDRESSVKWKLLFNIHHHFIFNSILIFIFDNFLALFTIFCDGVANARQSPHHIWLELGCVLMSQPIHVHATPYTLSKRCCAVGYALPHDVLGLNVWYVISYKAKTNCRCRRQRVSDAADAEPCRSNT